jgi:hypothetical protein
MHEHHRRGILGAQLREVQSHVRDSDVAMRHASDTGIRRNLGARRSRRPSPRRLRAIGHPRHVRNLSSGSPGRRAGP